MISDTRSDNHARNRKIMGIGIAAALILAVIAGLLIWCVNNAKEMHLNADQQRQAQQQTLNDTAQAIGASKGEFDTDITPLGGNANIFIDINGYSAAYSGDGRTCKLYMDDGSTIDCTMLYDNDTNTYIVYDSTTCEPITTDDD